MKKHLCLGLIATMLSLSAIAQEKHEPHMNGDALVTSFGYKLFKGESIKLGLGTKPDGDFKFIRISSKSIFRNTSATPNESNDANALNSRYANLKYEIIRFEKKGSKKHGYVYYAVINPGGLIGTDNPFGLVKYEIDVENALKAGELELPEQYQPKKEISTAASFSVSDELSKLKKLLDEGVINQDEFDKQKKKLLETN